MSVRSVGVLLLSLATVATAQGTTGSPTKELSALEHRWVEAMAKKDVANLERILAPNYTDTDEEGHQSNRADVLTVFRSGDLVFQSIKLSDLNVHSYGSAAVVTGTAMQQGAYKGQAVAPKVVFTDTFVKTRKGWMVVASQRTAVR